MYTNIVITMNIEEVIKMSSNVDIATKTVINIMYTSRWVEESVASILKEHDLSLPQYNVLRILRGQKGNPASLNCVQERMVDKNSNTTRLVDKLIAKGYTERQICPHNRRKVEIEITKQGLDFLTKLDPLTKEANTINTQNLSVEELNTLNHLLDKLRTHE